MRTSSQARSMILTATFVVTVVALFSVAIAYLFRPPRPAPTASSPELPCTINMVLDTSASMQGYLTGRTEFKDTLSHVVSAFDKYQHQEQSEKTKCTRSIAFQYATDSGSLTPSGDDSASFLDKLLNNELTQGQSSLLQEMFRNVVEESSGGSLEPVTVPHRTDPAPVAPPPPTELSILITDSIFSYSDAEIKKNREINKENIEGLASKVNMIFDAAQAAGKSVSILVFKSQFHGTYYDYQNRKIAWGASPRPYYMWIIGSPANVRAIRSFVQAEGILPDHALDFTVKPFDPSPSILQYTERKGNWNRHNDENPKRIHVKRPFPDDRNRHPDPGGDSEKEIEFAIALDLSQLSSDQLSSDYLANHLKVESQSPDLQIKTIAINTRQEIDAKLDPKDRGGIPRATHVVLITTDFRFTKTALLSISIDDALPAWYLDWSNEDDTRKDQHTLESTFGLKHFVEAIARAYRIKTPIAKTTVVLER